MGGDNKLNKLRLEGESNPRLTFRGSVLTITRPRLPDIKDLYHPGAMQMVRNRSLDNVQPDISQ